MFFKNVNMDVIEGYLKLRRIEMHREVQRRENTRRKNGV